MLGSTFEGEVAWTVSAWADLGQGARVVQDVGMHPHWVRRRLCVDDREISVGAGVALLWMHGNVKIRGASGEALLNSGDLVIADRTRLLYLEGPREWSAEALYIDDRRMLEYVGSRQSLGIVRCCGSDGLAQVMRQLWIVGDSLSHVEPDDRLIGLSLLDLVTRLGIRIVVKATEARAPAYVVDTVERARALIRAHLADHRFGASDLAHKMRVSPRYLSSLFAPFGTTTARAILEMRIERAKQLLADPVNAHRQIADIALVCGFEDQNYFARCFRTTVGQSPRAFRANKDFSV